MSNFYCENQGAHTYLIYEMPEEEQIDKVTLGMMTNNKIQGFLPVVYTQLDGKNLFKYDISAKIALSQYMSGILNRHKVVTIFRTIAETILSAEEYLIDNSAFVLNPEYIYVNVTTAEVSMICLPVISEEKTDIGMFFKSIMYNANMRYDPSENGDYIIKILNFFNSASIFSIEDFKNLLSTLDGESVKENKPQVSSQAVVKNDIKYESEPYIERKVSEENREFGRGRVPMDVDPPKTESLIGKLESVSEGIVNDLEAQIEDVKVDFEIPDIPSSPFEVPGSTTGEKEVENKKKFSLFGNNTKKEEKRREKEEKQREKELKKQKKGGLFGKKKETVQDFGMEIPGSKNEQIFDSVWHEENRSIEKPEPPIIRREFNHDIRNHEEKFFEENQNIDFGGTTVLDAGNEEGTVCLDDEKEEKAVEAVRARLIRIKNNQTIPVGKEVFKIGHSKNYVDYYIENPAISRSHAMIIQRGEKFFIVDTNSKNHTYVDGKMVASGTEVKLSKRTRIRLADEEFIFESV